MFSLGSLSERHSLFGEVQIATAPVYSLPKYVIPGNILVLPVGPLGSWDLRARGIGYNAIGSGYEKFYRGIDYNCELMVLPSNGSFSAKFVDRSSGLSFLPKSLTDISFSYDRSTGEIHLGFNKETVGDLRISGNTVLGNIAAAVQMSALIAPLYSPESTMGGVYGALYEVTGKKRAVELFVPLTTKTIIPSIVSGLTIVEAGSQILMEQGADRRSIVAAPLNPSPYIPPGNLMVILINVPHGLWKISYIVGGIENRGQLEIAEFGGKLVGRMNVSGGMLYGSSGWESISDVGFSGNTLSFVRDYTRQRWDGVISEDTIFGSYGGGPGTWMGTKEPVEVFVPTDITEYTKEIVVEKEMPLATVIPTETVSGKSTGTVLVEEGFAPTKEQAIVIQGQLIPSGQVASLVSPVTQAIVPIALTATKELLPTAQDSSLKLTLSEGGFQEILKKRLSGWGLLVLGGVGVLLFLGRGKEVEGKKGGRKRR